MAKVVRLTPMKAWAVFRKDGTFAIAHADKESARLDRFQHGERIARVEIHEVVQKPKPAKPAPPPAEPVYDKAARSIRHEAAIMDAVAAASRRTTVQKEKAGEEAESVASPHPKEPPDA